MTPVISGAFGFSLALAKKLFKRDFLVDQFLHRFLAEAGQPSDHLMQFFFRATLLLDFGYIVRVDR